MSAGTEGSQIFSVHFLCVPAAGREKNPRSLAKLCHEHCCLQKEFAKIPT